MKRHKLLNPDDDFSPTECGDLLLTLSQANWYRATSYGWSSVTCKKCLKKRPQRYINTTDVASNFAQQTTSLHIDDLVAAQATLNATHITEMQNTIRTLTNLYFSPHTQSEWVAAAIASILNERDE